jgi:hypothetical protein
MLEDRAEILIGMDVFIAAIFLAAIFAFEFPESIQFHFSFLPHQEFALISPPD